LVGPRPPVPEQTGDCRPFGVSTGTPVEGLAEGVVQTLAESPHSPSIVNL